LVRHTTSTTLLPSQHYIRRMPFAYRPPGMGGALRVGRKAIEKLFEGVFTESWSSSPAVGKLVQMYAFEDSIATISEWSTGQYNGHSVKIFVRDADTWKIRMEYNSIAPVVTH
jgi:hypothetical protein